MTLDRFYTQEDIDHLSLINHLVKERGMTLKGAKTKIKENKTETEILMFSSRLVKLVILSTMQFLVSFRITWTKWLL